MPGMFGLDGVAGAGGVIDGCDPALAASLVDGALLDGALFEALRDTLFASTFADAGASGAAGKGAGNGDATDALRAGIGATIDPARGARASAAGATTDRSPREDEDAPADRDDDGAADRDDDAAAAADAERDIDDPGSLPRAERRRGAGISSSGWIACLDGSVRSRGGSAGNIVDAWDDGCSSSVTSS